MKTTLTLCFILTFFSVYAQDTLKIKNINAIVLQINNSALPVKRDTLVENHPEMGLKMITYLSMVVNGGELFRYENYVNTSITGDGISIQMITSSTFYYNHNNLIKVEEYLLENNRKKSIEWYYADDKPLYYTSQSENAEERAASLLNISKTMRKQIIK